MILQPETGLLELEKNEAGQHEAEDNGQKTILLLGNYRPALVLARVLSRRGYKIICGDEGCDGGAEHSRSVDEIWHHPHLGGGPASFLTALDIFMERHPDLETIYPVSEEFVRFFAELSDPVRDSYPLAMVEPALVRRCLDKAFMMKLADDNSVPTAPYAVAHNHIEMAAGVGRTGFPLVIRPKISTQRISGRKAIICTDFSAVSSLLQRWPAGQRGLILQRKVSGRRHNIYFAATEGRLFRYLHAVITQTDNPDGTGLAVEGATIAPEIDLKRYTEQLVEALKYTGVGCAQYLVDAETGEVSFLEINPRIAGNHAVTEHAGLGLSTLLVDLAAGREINTDYVEGKPGITYVWTRGALQAAKLGYLRGELSGKAATVSALQSLWAGLCARSHVTFDWRDPKPSLMALWSLKPRLNRFRKPVLDRVSPTADQR